MKNLIISSLFVTAALLAQTPATSPSTNPSSTTDQSTTTKPAKVKKHHKAKKGDSTTTITPDSKAPASK